MFNENSNLPNIRSYYCTVQYLLTAIMSPGILIASNSANSKTVIVPMMLST